MTDDSGGEGQYVNLGHKEWQVYREEVPGLQRRPLRQLELGGGSPTFFSPDNLKRILEPIFADIQIETDQFRASVEVDPRRTSRDQLGALHALGFNRISLGVQDFDPVVQ